MSLIAKCSLCSQDFTIYEEDLAFYSRISPQIAGTRFALQPPDLCRFCREQQRLAFRNERALYRGKCALTQKDIISIYSADKPFTVYDQAVWWSDQYDPLSYGREFDFSRPFFEQFAELTSKAARICLFSSEYRQ